MKQPMKKQTITNSDRGALVRQIKDLTETNKDLAAQVRELLIAKPMNAEEWADVARIRAEHKSLNDSQNDIVIYLRNNFPEDLNGAPIPVIITRCLNRYKALMTKVYGQSGEGKANAQ